MADTAPSAEDFDAASAHVASLAAKNELPEAALLELYGLYKLATEGACLPTGRPGVFNLKARRKWDAWRAATDRGVAPGEPATAEYVAALTRLRPGWREAAAGAGGGGKQGVGGGAGGAVVSRMAEPEGSSEADADASFTALHAAAAAGDVGRLEQLLADGTVAVDARDGEGASALHVAADRGQLAAIDLLLRHGAALDAQDEEGLSPLHYCCLSEARAAAERLVAAGADVGLRSGNGSTAADLAPESWRDMLQ